MVTPLLPCWVHQQACRRPARQLDIPRTPACAAALRVCADGGANRLFDELPRMLPGQPAEAVRAVLVVAPEEAVRAESLSEAAEPDPGCEVEWAAGAAAAASEPAGAVQEVLLSGMAASAELGSVRPGKCPDAIQQPEAEWKAFLLVLLLLWLSPCVL